jgi:hypothetical protein
LEKYKKENELFTFRCGNYAFDKISNFTGFESTYYNTGELNLNGEKIFVYKMFDMIDKKEIIITPGLIGDFDYGKIFEHDIVLRFA